MCRQFRLSSRSVICTKGIVMTVMIAWLLCNLSLLRNTGTTYLWDEIAIVNRFSFSFLWINCLLIRNLSRICDHMTADTCLRIATVLNLSQKYSRLHHYTCFVESRICQRKFILKWLHQKGQTKNKKKTIKPRNLGLLSYWTLWTLWDWLGKEFEFVTTWPPMLVCVWLQFFSSQQLNVHWELYQQHILANYVKCFVVSNIIIIEGRWHTVSLVSKCHI